MTSKKLRARLSTTKIERLPTHFSENNDEVPRKVLRIGKNHPSGRRLNTVRWASGHAAHNAMQDFRKSSNENYHVKDKIVNNRYDRFFDTLDKLNERNQKYSGRKTQPNHNKNQNIYHLEYSVRKMF